METNNFNQLRLDVVRQFGMAIKKPKDLTQLKTCIETETKQTIGFNTLRRFFGFLETITPSYTTLSTLSKFLGYENYHTYQLKMNSMDTWINNERIIALEMSSEIKPSELKWLSSLSQSQDFYLKLISIVKSLLIRKKYVQILQLFQTKLFEISEPDQLVCAAHISLIMRKLPQKELKQMSKVLVVNRNFREKILYKFVDYSNLNGYYGDIIRQAQMVVSKNSHEALFCDLVLNFKNFLSNKNNLVSIPLNRIKPDYFVVLVGRCCAYNLIYFKETKQVHAYEKTWQYVLDKIQKEPKVNLLTLEIFPALFLVRDFEKISFLIKQYFEALLDPENWSGHKISVMVIIGQIFSLIKSNKTSEAEAILRLIKLNKISSDYYDYVLLFYWIAKYHLEKINLKHTETLREIEKSYTTIAKKTGFKRFSIRFLKTYLQA
jgi:hypothetical protein